MTRTIKAVFTLFMILLVIAALELGSWLILSLVDGEVFTWSTFRQQLAAVGASSEDPGQETEGAGEEYRVKSRQTIHPFLGYVSDADTHPAAADASNSREAIEHGFPRNQRDLFLEPREGRLVVAVFGGSVAGNLTAFRPFYLKNALARQPVFEGTELIVLSLANSGYKQPQQLMALSWFLALGAHFDLVVNLDGFNEIALPLAELIPNRVSPYFPRGWHLRVGDLGQELRLAIARLALSRERRVGWADRFARAPLRYSLLAALVWRLGDQQLAAAVASAELALLDGESSDSFHVRGPSYPSSDRGEILGDLAALWQRSSLQMHALCKEHGIPYYHFIQPNQYLDGSKPLSAEEKKKFWRKNHPYRPAVAEGYPLLLEKGAELEGRGVSFFDLTGIFREREETLYKDACCHLGFKGNQLLALAMAERIAEAWQEDQMPGRQAQGAR